MSIIHEYGLYEDDFHWEDLANCKDEDTALFFEDYEQDQVYSFQVDDMCLTCPVVKQCLAFGVETKSYGVFGGVYLENGKVSKNFNKHKSPAVWKRLRLATGVNLQI